MLHLDNPLSAPTLRLTPFQRGDNYPDTGGPRAIVSLSANLQAARVQNDIEYLRKARFLLLRSGFGLAQFCAAHARYA